GHTVTAFITGEGNVTPRVLTANTSAPSTALSALPKPGLPVTVTVGGVPAQITFVGIPSGLVGVTQINFTIPQGAPLGTVPMIVNVGGVDSPPAKLTVSAASGA